MRLAFPFATEADLGALLALRRAIDAYQAGRFGDDRYSTSITEKSVAWAVRSKVLVASRGQREELRANRGATHPVNAMLNYAYGVLIGWTQVQLIAEAYDPTIGILHGRESERGTYLAFVLCRMEPMRPVVDRAVLELVKTTIFSGGDFSIQFGWRLEAQSRACSARPAACGAANRAELLKRCNHKRIEER